MSEGRGLFSFAGGSLAWAREQQRRGQALLHARKLHLGHFAFMRAVVQRVDTRASWERYLRVEGEHTDRRLVRATIRWLREEMAMAARHRGRHGIARLLSLTLNQREQALATPEAKAPDLPSFDDFVAETGWSDFTLQEQVNAYHAAFGVVPGQGTQAGDPAAQARSARLIKRQLEALFWLEQIAAQPALAGDHVRDWFNPAVAGRLEAGGLPTLAALIERINEVGYRWFEPLPAIGVHKAGRIVDWLTDHQPTIGKAIGAHARSKRSLVPMPQLERVVAAAADIRPLEKLLVPAELDGSHGQYRMPQDKCLINAGNDYAAILSWLATKNGPRPAQARRRRMNSTADAIGAPQQEQGSALSVRLSNTQRAYRKEAERFLLWALFERGKALSSLNEADCVAYRAFLADPQPRERWCAARSRERWSPAWRPFAGALSPAAQRQAMVILNNLYEYLIRKNYVFGNPWADVAKPGGTEPKLHTERSFTFEQWRFIEHRLSTLADTLYHRRLKVALHLLYATGLRISEAVAAQAGDLEWVQYAPAPEEPDPVDGWWLKVTGKGGRERKVPLPYELTSALSAYFVSRGLDMNLEHAGNRNAFLLGNASAHSGDANAVSRRDPHGPVSHKDGISEAALHHQLKVFFSECAEVLAMQGDTRSQLRFEKASAHWLRHTHASHAINSGKVPIEIAQANLGHASLATTSIYVHTEERNRLKKMQGFFDTTAHRRPAPD